jgi:hypothetical protein
VRKYSCHVRSEGITHHHSGGKIVARGLWAWFQGATRLSKSANMKPIYLLCTAMLALGCAGNNTPAEHPVDVPRSLGEAPPPSQQAEAIPQFFWVEVTGNTYVASGSHVDVATLRALAAREANAGQVRGAALTLNDQTTEEQAIAAVRLLLEAGFRHVVLSSRVGLSAPEMSPVGATPIAPPVDVTPEQPSETVVAPQSEPAGSLGVPPADGPRVEVKQMGLHIGGGPNDPDHHAIYADPISRRFEDIRQCHSLVQDAPKRASFGVDLLIPAKGGKAKIENYRTAIGGKDFHLCVLGVFGSIDFKGAGKSTMVSYSVLFKPL